MMFLVYDMHENRRIVSIFLNIFFGASPQNPHQGLRPWTPLGGLRPQTPGVRIYSPQSWTPPAAYVTVGVGYSRRYCTLPGPGMTSLKDGDLRHSSALAQSLLFKLFYVVFCNWADTVQGGMKADSFFLCVHKLVVFFGFIAIYACKALSIYFESIIVICMSGSKHLYLSLLASFGSVTKEC